MEGISCDVTDSLIGQPPAYPSSDSRSGWRRVYLFLLLSLLLLAYPQATPSGLFAPLIPPLILCYGLFALLQRVGSAAYRLNEWMPSRGLVVADFTLLALASYALGSQGLVLYPLFLMIIVGTGLRRGRRYPLSAVVAGGAGFLLSAWASGGLYAEPFVYLALSASLMVIPLYLAETFQQIRLTDARLLNQIETNNFLTTHDPLTGLANRNLLDCLLDSAIAGAQRGDWGVTVLFIDIDDFHVINDSYGHLVGDALLQQVAKNIGLTLRDIDVVGRIGGDDFVVILKSNIQAGLPRRGIERLIQGVSGNYTINQVDHFIDISIGASVYPTGGESSQALIKNSDTAMYEAKRQGGSCYRVYDGAMSVLIEQQLSLQGDLRQAIKNREFVLYYQPQIAVGGGALTGVEALIRWQHPTRGMIPPDQFIPIAERCGLIDTIGEWVLQQACSDRLAWLEAGIGTFRVAVNISAHQLNDLTFDKKVSRIVKASGIAPELLELEVTESMLMQNIEQSITMLSRIRDLGIGLAMDDFGTGYSSLSYLQRFPFDTLKVDRSFINEITSDPEQSTIARTIIAMGERLGMRVLAEGVETEEQANYLGRYRCDELQGYLISRPLPECELRQFIASGNNMKWASPLVNGHQRSLLLVDDEPISLTAVSAMLAGQGYQLYTTTSFMEAFQLLADHPIDVVIADLQMPEMDGVEFLYRVRILYPETARIILSGEVDIEFVSAAINRGAVCKFLTKPSQPKELQAVVQEVMNVSMAMARI